jgi:hypothetical protein
LADSSTAATGEVESFKLKVESIPAAPRKETCNLQSATCNLQPATRQSWRKRRR